MVRHLIAHVISGVPQGSILGPLLFLVCIDDVTNIPFSPGTRIVLYADDILMYRTISSNSDYVNLQTDANAIQDWVNFNHMSLNSSKCKFMLISRKRNRMTNPPTITINGNTLETVPTFKYLGLLLHLICLGLGISKEYAPKQRKSWAYCTVDFTNMPTSKLFANYIYPLYGPTWSMQHLYGTHT